MKNKKGLEYIIYFICFVVILAFIFYLPEISNMTKNRLSKEVIEKEVFPTSLVCDRVATSDLDHYSLTQHSVYNIQNERVTTASIEKNYTFLTKEAYLIYKETEAVSKKEDYEVVTFTFNEESLTIKEVTEVNDVEKKNKAISQFPYRYENLLIYTKGQDCIKKYN